MMHRNNVGCVQGPGGGTPCRIPLGPIALFLGGVKDIIPVVVIMICDPFPERFCSTEVIRRVIR